MISLLWIVMAFIAGAIPFSVLVGRLALGTDIRQVGDHNPGATNVTRAGGWRWGLLAVVLDILKGAIPVWLAWDWGPIGGWPLVAVALAPMVGHAYSPFLGFKGGKAIAVTGGVWGGLSLGLFTLTMGVMLTVWYLVIAVDGWVVVLTLLTYGVYLLVTGADVTLIAIWAGTVLLLTWKHRADLRQTPRLREWLGKRIG